MFVAQCCVAVVNIEVYAGVWVGVVLFGRNGAGV